MDAYKTYMDRQSLSPAAHDRLMALGTASRKTAGTVLAVGTTEEPSLCLPAQRTHRYSRWLSLAACAALILGVGTYGLSRTDPGPDRPSPIVQDPLASPDPEGDISIGVSSGEGDRYGFVALSGSEDKLMFPTLPDITYTEGSMESAACIALPDGSYANPLHEEDVEIMLWGSLENKDYAHFKAQTQTPVGSVSCTVPAALFWDGFGLTGEARYDGEGNLWLVTLWGSRGDEHFTIELSPGKLPPTSMMSLPLQGETSEVNGVPVKAQSLCYDSDGDGVKEYHYWSAFLTNDIGVRAKFVVPETADGHREENAQGQLDPVYDLTSDLFIKYVCGNPSFTLDHLMTDDNIPPWEETSFETLEEARQRTEFAPYLPQTAPVDWSEFYGRISYQEGDHNYLFVRWTRRYDNVEIDVHLPEGDDLDYYHSQLVDVNVPESYDWRLYDGPISDTVPQEYRSAFYKPAFRAEDLSLEVIESRMHAHDTGGEICHFYVLHENGTVVSYDCSGVTAETVWAMVEPTL